MCCRIFLQSLSGLAAEMVSQMTHRKNQYPLQTLVLFRVEKGGDYQVLSCLLEFFGHWGWLHSYHYWFSACILPAYFLQ